MIVGRVNSYLEAVVRFPLRGLRGEEQAVEAVIDTGFNGYLTLPPDLIAKFGLPFLRRSQAILGDGSAITFDIHEAVVLWDGQPLRIPVDAADTNPLLGMRLLYGNKLDLEAIEDGDVLVHPLPRF